MHATTIAAIMAFLSVQVIAAPTVELAYVPKNGIGGKHDGMAGFGSLSKRTVIETSSTGDEATDAKVAEELKKAEPQLREGGQELASLAADEQENLSNLLDALEAAVSPLLEMAETMEAEASLVQGAEADAQAGAPASGEAYSSISSTTAGSSSTTAGSSSDSLSRRDPFFGLIAPVLNTVGKLVSKRQELREIERRKINGELVGGLVDGLGNLGGSIISLFDKRDAEFQRRRLSGDAWGGIASGVGNLAGSIIGLFD